MKGSLKESPQNPKQYFLSKAFSVTEGEGSAKKKLQKAFSKDENGK